MPEVNAFCDRYHDKIEKLLQDAASNETEHESFRRRLKELDATVKTQNGILVTLQKQGDAIENMGKSLARIETTLSAVGGRVEKIEAAPGDKWKKITYEIVKYIVLAAVGVAVGYVIKGA
nr:MAG TPA: Sec20 [Caudoviricetes sp.]